MADKAIVLRIDLAYVPWSASADEFGHGEPAALLKLLELARGTGLKFHFFASTPALRAFPTAADAVLGEGHDLDWLCLNPGDVRAAEDAKERFALAGNSLAGFAFDDSWTESESPSWAQGLKFLSANPGAAPKGLELFPVPLPSDAEAIRASGSLRQWEDAVKQAAATLSGGETLTVVLHPQVLAKHDPSLKIVSALAEIAAAQQIAVRTLRDLVRRKV